MTDTTRRKMLGGIGAAITTALAGCAGGMNGDVESSEASVADTSVRRVEIAVNGEDMDKVVVYPEDNVVCFHQHSSATDQETHSSGCVRDEELTQKYMDIYKQAADAEGEAEGEGESGEDVGEGESDA